VVFTVLTVMFQVQTGFISCYVQLPQVKYGFGSLQLHFLPSSANLL